MKLTIRRIFLYGFHLFAAVASYVFAYLLRFDFVLPLEEMPRFWRSLPILLGARFAAYLYYRLFQGWWSYTSLKDAELVV